MNVLMNRINVLVFPCGSEIGLEIYRSLNFSMNINLIGASSVSDHGKFTYKNYIDGVPFISDENFEEEILKIVKKYKIDCIYPTMDSVITKLKSNENKIGCKVISSELKTTEICLSKTKTYTLLNETIKVPQVYSVEKLPSEYPLFLKPDIGYGSRNTFIVSNYEELITIISKHNDLIVCEYLPGDEYTVDCFTDNNQNLIFIGARKRNRLSNGISVNTRPVELTEEIKNIAIKINLNLKFKGAWFFQLKKNKDGEMVLLEIASRIGGSSGLHRVKGINFTLLTIFVFFNIPVSIIENDYKIELDRALSNKYKLEIHFQHVYVDLDDTLIIFDKINHKLIGVLYDFINQNKVIHLITKHSGNLVETLKLFKIENIFDEIIHLKKEDNKWEFIKFEDSIFIDDSFSERQSVFFKRKIPVFSVDMIEVFN